MSAPPFFSRPNSTDFGTVNIHYHGSRKSLNARTADDRERLEGVVPGAPPELGLNDRFGEIKPSFEPFRARLRPTRAHQLGRFLPRPIRVESTDKDHQGAPQSRRLITQFLDAFQGVGS